MISKELSIGRAGEYYTLADLLLKGVQAFDTGQGVGYDICADVNGKLIKLQVKTTQKMVIRNERQPIYFFHIKRVGKNGNRKYNIGDFDAFALVMLDIKQVAYLKYDDRVKSSSICLRDKTKDYLGVMPSKRYEGLKLGRVKGIYYQDLTWENLIEAI